MYSVLYTAVPGPTGIANSFQQRRQHDRARTHRVQKGEKEWKIWPSSTQYSLPVSDPAGRRASLSPDHKGNQQNHRPGQTSRSNAQRKKGTRTQHTYQRNTQGVLKLTHQCTHFHTYGGLSSQAHGRQNSSDSHVSLPLKLCPSPSS